MKLLDLFSGIGGFSYAAERIVGGYETIAFCEYDQKAQQVLRKHWPNTEIINDVRTLADDADRFRGLVDIICGGYPCQPFSQAGKRLGNQDDRHLWPAMLAVIKAVRPTWVVGENVAGHISLGLDTVLSDLESAGYTSRCYVIPAVAVDAPHRRDRVWVVAHAISNGQSDGSLYEKRLVANAGCQRQRAKVSGLGGQSIYGSAAGQRTKTRDGFADSRENVADTNSQRGCSRDAKRQDATATWKSPGHQRHDTRGMEPWLPEPPVGRVAHGVPGRVDRLKQLGNSIVPQVAAQILWAIREAHGK
jgi:DNA (cytosine-5)-methyltransferase 1